MTALAQQTVATVDSALGVTLQPAPASLPLHSDHRHLKRFFIGPLPKQGLVQIQESRRILRSLAHLDSSGDDYDSLASISEERLWRVIQRTRERAASDWEHDQEPGLRDELVQKLRNSPWSGLASKKPSTKTKWVGDTFEVGTDLLGTPVLVEDNPPSSRGAASMRATAPSTSRPATDMTSSPLSSSYYTALASPENPRTLHSSYINTPHWDTHQSEILSPSSDIYRLSSDVGSHAKSDTYLLPLHRPSSSHVDSGPSSQSVTPKSPSRPRTEVLRSAFRRATTQDQRHQDRRVSFMSGAQPQQPVAVHQSSRRSDASPADPSDVLARSDVQGELGHTSAGAVINAARGTHGHRNVVLQGQCY